jgi:hypothetical protein
MPRSGTKLPPAIQTAADLRRRAARLYEIAREFPTDGTAEKLRALAAELEARAQSAERPVKRDVPDA